MLRLLQHLNSTKVFSKDRRASEDCLKRYLNTNLRIVSHQNHGDLPEPLLAAAAWGLGLSSHDFYRQLARSLESSGTIDLPEEGLSGRHSLSLRDATWLVLQQDQFGAVALLQRNYSCEAILFVDLQLFLIRREGRVQEQILHRMLLNVLLRQDEVRTYLTSTPVFGGINFTFPSPFHTINFGHTALYRIAQDPLLLRTTAWLDPAGAWFDPSTSFPAVVADLRAVPNPCPTFIELATPEPMFLFKPGHVYSKNEEPLNRQVELALMAASRTARPAAKVRGFRLWLGFTSGKRALVNEIQLMVALVKLLVQSRQLQDIVIDGWTGSSFPYAAAEDTPSAYSSHEDEFATLRATIESQVPGITFICLIGCSYEEKLRAALQCDFFFTSAYTASILPSRFCALRGVVHTSNRGLPQLRMHIHRRALFVPPELVEDQPFEEGLDTLDTSYAIPVEPFVNWVNETVLAALPLQVERI